MSTSIDHLPESQAAPADAASARDSLAVAAIKQGETERFRELVERHERLVYAVAWSRLGDAHLAEEVTQETFIRAYRRLWLLGDGARFAGWVSTIARRLAINFGLRHRRELNKRQRWAIENPGPGPSSTPASGNENDSAPPCTPELLQKTLAELPPAHRECLILFYLEKRSGSEAAAALGISETNFRVRLHRARAALREQLEKRIEHSLADLRPGRTLVPIIMTAILSSSSAKAAGGGVGTVVLGTIGKFAPVQWLFALLPALFAIPMMLISWLNFRAELANYRDPGGFRARQMRQQGLRGMVLITILMGLFLVGLQRLELSQRFVNTAIGFGLVAFLLLHTRKQLQLNRSRHYIANAVATGIFGAGMLLTGFGLIAGEATNFFILIQVLILTAVHGLRPNRLDYNLFLRASEGLLYRTPSPATQPTAANPMRFQKADLLQFARFLGTRWIADDFRWTSDGLQLRLPRATATRWHPPGWLKPWADRSTLHLGFNGTAEAHLSPGDKSALQSINSSASVDSTKLEFQVLAAVESAWTHFRGRSMVDAELAVGQVPESEVFLKSPAKAGSARWQFRAALFLLALWTILLGSRFLHPTLLSGQNPVQATQTEVEHFLNTKLPSPTPNTLPANSSPIALFNCLVLPSTNLFSHEALVRMRDEVAGPPGFDALRNKPGRAVQVFAAPLLRRAVGSGWISWADLNSQPEAAAEFLTRSDASADGGDQFLTRREAWSWVQKERYPVRRISVDGLTQLRLWKSAGRLDQQMTAGLIRQISATQILSARSADQPEMHNWKSVRGLFFTPCFPALEDTYVALAALEICGGLDRIDREACIQGILKLHQGGGFFLSPTPGSFNEYHVDGSARDTFSAYESLRILGGLDRVKDLEKWQFRVASRNLSKPGSDGHRVLTWAEVEAWVCRENFQRILQKKRLEPNSVYGSLAM